MTATREGAARAKTALGIALAVAHVAAFAVLAPHIRGTELAVELHGARAGTVPAAIAARVHRDVEPDAPGLRRARWRVDYRGGYAREVGATALVGPAQSAQACTARVVVGQRMLDALAPLTAELVDGELRGTAILGLGEFVRVDAMSLRWARVETHLFDYALLGPTGAPHGYVRATATLIFERVSVPLTLALVPERAAAALRFRVAAHAELAFGNRVVEWLNERLPTDAIATRLANRELDAALVTTLAPPPPVELSDGQVLRFVYCDGPVEVQDGAWGAVPFGVAFAADAAVAPPHFAAGPRVAPRSDTMLALDLDVDALDAMLYELWRTKWLDRRLAEAGLDRRFNADPTVAQYLSVRVDPPTLALPPVVEPAGDHLRLAADARVRIRDGDTATTGRVFGALALRFPARVELQPLELACERGPKAPGTTLVPCYADLVAGIGGRADELDGALARAFAALVRQIFVGRRIAVGDVPVALAVRGATLELGPGARSVHVELDAKLVK